TGDFSIAAFRACVERVIGIDISANMVDIGRRKVREAGLEECIDLQIGDSEQMSFADNAFDAVTVAFGVRNFEHLEAGLKEMLRVLRPGGKVVILEFSMPERFPMKQLYTLYFRHILPTVGGWISGNKSAYTYLPASVMKFPQGQAFLDIMRSCGFASPVQHKLTFGIASLYVGEKPTD
ncbi:MAG: ubiquinone/menaquinone biosynthesis methyltransferase, partial [Odoribacter sp.]|nr:ubiquinone/menaquinone biosynthesis methyltransferase [Odoribacter sp.]